MQLCANWLSFLLAIIHLRFVGTTISPEVTDITNVTTVRDSGDENAERYGPGISFIRETCAPASIAALNKALNSTADLAQAAINAAANFSSAPFNKFFLPDPGNATFVAEGMQRVIDSIQGRGVPIGLMCWDVKNLCGVQETLAYALPSNKYIPIVAYCPDGLALPVNPPPCTRPPQTWTIGQLTLHEFWHLPQISGTEDSILDEGYSVVDVMADVAAGHDSTNNAHAYALLGGAGFDLGLLDMDKGGHTCIENLDKGFRNEGAPVSLFPVFTYCLLSEPGDACGPGFECRKVGWSKPELMIGKWSKYTINEVGACVSTRKSDWRPDFTG